MQGICSTCLSSDRIVRPLHSFSVKNTLWEWFDVGGSGNFNVNLDEFKLCWECHAMLIKLNEFKKQVFRAQKIRLKVAQKKSRHLINLSRLSTYTKTTFDVTYKHKIGSNSSFKPKDDVVKKKAENGKHKVVPTATPSIHRDKERKEKISNESKKKHKKHNESDEGYKKKKDDTTDDTSKKVVKKKVKSKTRSGNSLSIEPETDEDRYERRSSVDSKIKFKKRKLENDDEESFNKRIKEATNVGPNVGTSKDMEEPNDSELELPEVKFTIEHLNEEQMLRNRDIDRNARIYKRRAFKCESCIIGFTNNNQFEKHNKEKHSEIIGKLKCPICNVRFVKKGFLKLHQDNHYRSYKCRQCDFEHHRRYAIDSHVVKMHDLKPSPVCLACDIEFDSKLLLINHYETAHEEVLKCDSEKTSSTEAAATEVDMTVTEVDSTVEEVQSTVEEQIKSILKEVVLTAKEVESTAKEDESTFKEIDLTVEDQDEVTKTDHVDAMKCVLCDRTFIGKASYRAHMQFAHRTLAEFAYCTDCDIQFPSVHKYKKHLNDSTVHSQVKELIFDCAHCYAKFPNKEYLLAHIVRAHRLLSHTCAMCNKGFSDPDRLKNHIELKHPDVIKSPKDKKCPICSKGYVTRLALLHHIRTHTAEKPFQCEQCEKRFAIKTMLNKHTQRMHQDDNNN